MSDRTASPTAANTAADAPGLSAAEGTVEAYVATWNETDVRNIPT